jgi:hypothetical protein
MRVPSRSKRIPGFLDLADLILTNLNILSGSPVIQSDPPQSRRQVAIPHTGPTVAMIVLLRTMAYSYILLVHRFSDQLDASIFFSRKVIYSAEYRAAPAGAIPHPM